MTRFPHSRSRSVRGIPSRILATRTDRRSVRSSNLGACWMWMGDTVKGGYGRLSLSASRKELAHRYAYEALVGPIPDGKTLDHLCRNPQCVNPAHLEPVSQRENILRGDTLASRNAAKTHCPQGHPYDEENTYRRPDGGRDCKACIIERSRRRNIRRRSERPS